MNKSLRIRVVDNEGNDHSCLLIGEDNNENGRILYTFKNERSGALFTLSKNDDTWTHLNGDLPQGCVAQLGIFLDSPDNSI